MAVKKISELSAASAADGTEVLPIVQSGSTVKATIDQVGTETLRTTIPLIPTSGATANIKSAETTLSDISSGATAASLIPDGVIAVAVSTYVTDTITGSGVTGYKVGDGSDDDRYGDITGTAIGTTSDNTDWTAATIAMTTAAEDVVITATGGSFTAGGVHVVVHYIDSTAPTS